MRNQVIVLILLSLFAVTLSRDRHKRYANMEDERALLDALASAIEERKLDVNDLLQDDRRDLKKRWWWNLPAHGAGGGPGKK